MGLDFELDEKNEDQADENEKSSYVSLSRPSSKVLDTRSASSLDFGDHCSPSITKLPKNSREGKEVSLIMSDEEPEDYRKGLGSKRRLPDSEALGSKLKEELCKTSRSSRTTTKAPRIWRRST